MASGGTVLWVDASAGVAGDMLLAALLDAGASPSAVREAVEAVIPGTVRWELTPVTRAGLRAQYLRVELMAPDQPHRSWQAIRGMLTQAALAPTVRDHAIAVFAALAQAEGRVHAVAADDVHFHEVGAWDSIADIVGVCAALADLGIDGSDSGAELVVGPLALGSGAVATQHGVLAVPTPAVFELCRGLGPGWVVTSGGSGELATPTGVALLASLGTAGGPMPTMSIDRVGVGAGSRDPADRANVVRVVRGTFAGQVHAGSSSPSLDLPDLPGLPGLPDLPSSPDWPDDALTEMTLVEATVDDLDPRVWPTLIDDLLEVGAADAWITPVLMKKGRPGHVLAVLVDPGSAAAIRRLVLDRTSTLGVRQTRVLREVLDRAWVDVDLWGAPVAVKVGHRDGVVAHATAEFDDVLRLARHRGLPVSQVLAAADAAAAAAGIAPGTTLPAGARVQRTPADRRTNEQGNEQLP